MYSFSTIFKAANENIDIIPINIIFNKIPYKTKNGIIKKIENIDFDKTYKITENLVKKKICSDIINLIIDVEHICKIGEKYDKCPKIIGFNNKTPLKHFKIILHKYIK